MTTSPHLRPPQPSTSAHSSCCPSLGSTARSRRRLSDTVPPKSKLGSVAPPSDIPSATNHFGALSPLVVAWIDSPFTVATLPSAVPLESTLGSVLISEAELLADAQRLSGGAVPIRQVRTVVLSLTVPPSVISYAIEQDETLKLLTVFGIDSPFTATTS